MKWGGGERFDEECDTDLLDEVVDGDERSGAADTGAAVDEDGAAVGRVVLVEAAQEAQNSRGVLGRLEVLPHQVMVLEHGSHFALHHAHLGV